VSDLFLGIDIGTASAKAALTTAEGKVVATAARPHRMSIPRPGWAEHDPESIWWDGVVTLCRELLGDGERVPAAVCVSGIGPCLLAADEDFRPLRPAILYGLDTRAAQEISDLTDELGADAILERGGSGLSTQAVGPKLLWLRRHEPEVWEATRRLLMASSFAVARLTGEYMLDHHSASQCDPLYDLERNEWIADWAERIAPGLELPRLLWPGEQAGAVSDAGAAATGIPAGTPVMAGTIDAWAESLAAGVREPGDVMVMYGSTLFLIEVTAGPLRDESLWSTAGIREGSYSLAAGLATSGTLLVWLSDLTGASFDELSEQAEAAGPGAGGLLALPYFSGERTPILDPAARGVLCGLTLAHGPGHIARALLEAIAFGVRHNLETFEGAGAATRRLVAVGGGTQAAVTLQAVSDITGRSQDVCAAGVGASHGDAFLAAAGVGAAGWDDDWSAIDHEVEPRREHVELYAELYGRYRDLYPATRDVMHMLARVGGEAGDQQPQEV
jgi:xylulokinase